MNHVFLYDHSAFRDHDTGPGHPERPERLEAIVRGIRSRGLDSRLDWVEAEVAAPEHPARVHHAGHLRRMLDLRGQSGIIDADTRVSPASIDASLRATGAAVSAVGRVLAEPRSGAFCLCRPPGHHAESGRAMGFCLFNHVAAAAAYALAETDVQRVLIFDPDVHHGNGTQEIFYGSPDVCFVSIHQSPLFPGSGAATETGAGEGHGATVNFPLPAGMGDAEYRYIVEEAVLPLIRRFEPGLVLFSAGFDAHQLDPLGGMNLSSAGFAGFYRPILEELEGREVPAVFCLEGGYSTDALAECVPAVLDLMLHGATGGAALRSADPEVVRLVADVRNRIGL